MSVTPAEGQIMDALWRRNPLTIEDIAEAVSDRNGAWPRSRRSFTAC
jgi:predicted transcriptional regulator